MLSGDETEARQPSVVKAVGSHVYVTNGTTEYLSSEPSCLPQWLFLRAIALMPCFARWVASCVRDSQGRRAASCWPGSSAAAACQQLNCVGRQFLPSSSTRQGLSRALEPAAPHSSRLLSAHTHCRPTACLATSRLGRRQFLACYSIFWLNMAASASAISSAGACARDVCACVGDV